MSKAFASQADLADKKITFEQLSPHCWAYTAEGDPNSGVIIGDRFIMVSDATATPAMADDNGLSGSWMCRRQDDGSTDKVRLILSFAAGGVIVSHDISPTRSELTLFISDLG